MNFTFFCLLLITLCTSRVSRPFKRRRKGLVHITRTCARGPQNKRILPYTLCLSSIELHIMQNPRMITMVMRVMWPVAIWNPSVCACIVSSSAQVAASWYLGIWAIRKHNKNCQKTGFIMFWTVWQGPQASLILHLYWPCLSIVPICSCSIMIMCR